MQSDPRKYVREWLQKKGMTVDARGALSNTQNRDNNQIFNTMYLDYCEYISASNAKYNEKLKATTDKNLQRAFNEFLFDALMEQRKKTIASLKYSGTPTLVPMFVEAMIGKPEPKVVAVISHFLWTIKRKLLGKPVVYHLMPIILGKQEAGKSYAIEKLLSPIEPVTMEISLTEVIDPRFHVAFSKNFAIIINEMAGANKTDVEKLKNLITTTNNDTRTLHTNDVIKVKQNATLIGTTNKPVAEIIYDTTGARRFYEIKSLDRLHWSIINELDYVALWQGIDENKERGYYEEYQDEIKKDQEALVGIEELQVFLDLYNMKPGNKEVAASVIYDAYKTWCDSNGVKNTLNSVWFGRKLQGKGFVKAHQKRVRGKNTLLYLVNEDSEMHAKAAYDPLGVKEFQ